MQPHCGSVVDQSQVVLHVAVRAEDECLGGGTGREVLQVLGGEAVQPGQPVLAGDAQHSPVGAVDQAGREGKRALLRIGVAIVRGDA